MLVSLQPVCAGQRSLRALSSNNQVKTVRKVSVTAPAAPNPFGEAASINLQHKSLKSPTIEHQLESARTTVPDCISTLLVPGAGPIQSLLGQNNYHPFDKKSQAPGQQTEHPSQNHRNLCSSVEWEA